MTLSDLPKAHQKFRADGKVRAIDSWLGADQTNEVMRSEVSGEDIVHQLTKILNSKTFADAQRLKEFLHYLVSQLIAGKSSEIKEYTIAVEVFGKPATFDCRVDPIVRVEASRLRSKLKTYRYKEGKSDGLVILLPKRGYKPIVRPNLIQKRHAVRKVLCNQEFAIAVLPFVVLAAGSINDGLGHFLTDELTDKMMDIPGVWALPTTVACRFKDNPELIYKVARELSMMLLLIEGSVQMVEERIRIRARLISVKDGVGKRLGSYDARPEIAGEVDKILQAVTNQVKEELFRVKSGMLLGNA